MAFFTKKIEYKGKCDLSAFVTEKGRIKIDKYYWQKINNRFEKEEIKKAIVDLVMDRKLPLPMSYTNKDYHIALKAFRQLQNLDTKKLVKKAKVDLFVRGAGAYPITRYYIETSKTGNKASDYFHRNARMKCASGHFKPPAVSWRSRKYLAMCLNSLWSLKTNQVNDTLLFTCLQLKQYAASQFRPSAAKAIYELFGAKRVLDTSAGWGDRFAGFSSSKITKEYLGIDPNTALHKGYKKQVQAYNTGKKARFLHAAAEDVILPRGYFDIAFTSPPYFNTEKYSEDDGQSWIRYNDIDKWMDQFLYVVLDKSIKALAKGGVLAINIADLGVKEGQFSVCNAMNDYLSAKPGVEFLGGMGLKMASRPNTGIKKNEGANKTMFAEPIWVWGKEANKPLEKIVYEFLMPSLLTISRR